MKRSQGRQRLNVHDGIGGQIEENKRREFRQRLQIGNGIPGKSEYLERGGVLKPRQVADQRVARRQQFRQRGHLVPCNRRVGRFAERGGDRATQTFVRNRHLAAAILCPSHPRESAGDK